MLDPNALNEFRYVVLGRAELVERLLPIGDIDGFVAAVVAAGAENGFRFDAEDVTAALRAGQMAWLSHWSAVAI